VPAAFRNNTPERIHAVIGAFQQSHDLFPRFPFGCDFTEDELKLGKALKGLKAKGGSTKGKIGLFCCRRSGRPSRMPSRRACLSVWGSLSPMISTVAWKSGC